MATKIGFDAKLAGTGVDWATVGKDVSETLIQQEQQREKNRVAMDKAVADEIKTLAGTELGKDAQANQWIMNGVGAITGSSLMDSRLLKNGLLSSRDFSRNLANRTQGTELVLQAYSTYNKDYDEIMEKINSGDLSEKTLQARAQVESMFDFANTDIFINPTDSEVNVSKKVLKDGVMVMSDNPDDFMNASELMQGATAQYAKFQANDEAKALADAVAQRLIRDIGGETIEGAYQAVSKLPKAEQDKLNEARKLQIQAVLTDDKAGSFLVDTLNKTLKPGEGPYSFTKNKDEAARDKFKILMNQDGSNNFTTDNGKKQMKLAVEKFDVMLEGFLPAKRTAPLPKAPKPQTQSQRNYGTNVKNFADYGLTIVEAITTDSPEESAAALAILSEFGIDTSRIKKNKEGLTFEIFNKNTKVYETVPVKFKEGDFEGSLKRILQKTLGRNTKVDIDDIMEAMGGKEFFKDKEVSDIESLFSPKETIEVKPLDDPSNIMLNPLKPFDTVTGKENFVTAETIFKIIEDEEYNDDDELQKYLKGLLTQQGLKDITVEVQEAGKTISPLARFFGTTPEERYAIIKRGEKELELINLNDIKETFRDEINRITKKAQSEETFYEGPVDDGVREKKYKSFAEYKEDFPKATLADFATYKKS